jgi:ArsR family transcriptional regulator, arsenate/arsenite/antimonite-responsive transcriptional repressor
MRQPLTVVEQSVRKVTAQRLAGELRPAQCCAPLVAPDIEPAEAELTARLFKALADPNRVRMVSILANAAEPVCVCDLTADIGLVQGTVSFHLKKLLEAGLIDREQRGTWAYYSLNRGALRRVSEIFTEGGN